MIHEDHYAKVTDQVYNDKAKNFEDTSSIPLENQDSYRDFIATLDPFLELYPEFKEAEASRFSDEQLAVAFDYYQELATMQLEVIEASLSANQNLSPLAKIKLIEDLQNFFSQNSTLQIREQVYERMKLVDERREMLSRFKGNDQKLVRKNFKPEGEFEPAAHTLLRDWFYEPYDNLDYQELLEAYLYVHSRQTSLDDPTISRTKVHQGLSVMFLNMNQTAQIDFIRKLRVVTDSQDRNHVYFGLHGHILSEIAAFCQDNLNNFIDQLSNQELLEFFDLLLKYICTRSGEWEHLLTRLATMDLLTIHEYLPPFGDYSPPGSIFSRNSDIHLSRQITRVGLFLLEVCSRKSSLSPDEFEFLSATLFQPFPVKVKSGYNRRPDKVFSEMLLGVLETYAGPISRDMLLSSLVFSPPGLKKRYLDYHLQSSLDEDVVVSDLESLIHQNILSTYDQFFEDWLIDKKLYAPLLKYGVLKDSGSSETRGRSFANNRIGWILSFCAKLAVRGIQIDEDAVILYLINALHNDYYADQVSSALAVVNWQVKPDLQYRILTASNKSDLALLAQITSFRLTEPVVLEFLDKNTDISRLNGFLSDQELATVITDNINFFDTPKKMVLTKKVLTLAGRHLGFASKKQATQFFRQAGLLVRLSVTPDQPDLSPESYDKFLSILGSVKENSIYHPFFEELLETDKLSFLQNGELLCLDEAMARQILSGNIDYQKIYEALTTNQIGDWADELISKPFLRGAEIFGYKKMFNFISRNTNNRHLLYSFEEVIKLYSYSGLTTQKFYENILSQVAVDQKTYMHGQSAHDRLNSIAKNFKPDFQETARILLEYSDTFDLDEFSIQLLSQPDDIFASWSSLEHFDQLRTLLHNLDVIQALGDLKNPSQKPLFNFCRQLLFDENRSVGAHTIQQMFHEPDAFVGRRDNNAPVGLMDRLSPINYTRVPYLDLNSRKLITSMVDGTLDTLRFFPPFQILYEFTDEQGNRLKVRAAIELKNDPIAATIGDRIDSCMGLATGKQMNYLFSPACAQFTLSVVEPTEDWIAQSVMVPYQQISQVVSNLYSNTELPNLSEIFDPELLEVKPVVVGLDNIQGKPPAQYQELKPLFVEVYRHFFGQFLATYGQTLNLDSSVVPVGSSYSYLAAEVLPDDLSNTFVQRVPVAYTDNSKAECYQLAPEISDERLRRYFLTNFEVEAGTPNPKFVSPEDHVSGRGVQPLSYLDSIQVGYLESMIYADNPSLLQGWAELENILIALEYHHAINGSPNLCLKYIDSNKTMKGYLIAWEGKHYNQEIIYIDDLAATNDSPLAGGRLIKAFIELYAKTYIENGKLMPILFEARHHTSYQLLLRHLSAAGKPLGITFKANELGESMINQDTMHQVIIYPEWAE